MPHTHTFPLPPLGISRLSTLEKQTTRTPRYHTIQVTTTHNPLPLPLSLLENTTCFNSFYKQHLIQVRATAASNRTVRKMGN